MDDKAAESSTGRSRSFGGCATCRNRHMKCDEERPSCRACRNNGIVCGGYEKAIFFDFEGTPEPGSLRFRRPLLTEQERRSMSEYITSTVPSILINRSLSQIDEECESSAASSDIQISRGPFGAFRVRQTFPAPGESSALIQSVDICDDMQDNPQNSGVMCATGTTFSPETQQSIDGMLELPLNDATTYLFDVSDIFLDGSRIQEIFDDTLSPRLNASAYYPDMENFHHPLLLPEPTTNVPIECVPGSAVTTADNILPHDAVLLLRHYQTVVLQLLTPFRHSKTPWHVLFVPHVKCCLAALTLGECIDFASLCLFHGVLAISAFSMSGLSQSSTWADQARRYKQQAREYGKSMLKTAYNIPKAAKYKTILMALLTLVQVSMVTGNRDQTECYFLEAEKFIRLRGLNRKKSTKVRLLHHCYAFERILHESTLVESLDSSHRLHVREAVESSGLAIFQDNTSFRLGTWKDLDQDMKREKGQEEGENDLHLEYPGVWPATLYPEIFGVSETWVSLVSLVVRLARERDTAQHEGAADNLSAKDFLGRAKAIERCINQIREPKNVDHGVDPAVESMLDAMRNALSIYFYRRIYDIDPALLQHKVKHVRDCLLSYNNTTREEAHGSARLLWPVIIAASEAAEPDVQVSFANWLRGAAQKSGLRLFGDTLSNLEHIWKEKNMHSGKPELPVQVIRVSR